MASLAAAVTLAMAVVSCGASSSATDGMTRAERKAWTAQQVRDKLAKRHYRIIVTMMQPQGFPARTLTTPHFVEIVGDSINSYLPYYGRAYAVPYGGGKGLNFEAHIKAYEEQRNNRKKLTRCRMLIKTEEDNYLYTIEVFDNGASTVDVHSQNRDFILFGGEMEIE